LIESFKSFLLSLEPRLGRDHIGHEQCGHLYRPIQGWFECRSKQLQHRRSSATPTNALCFDRNSDRLSFLETHQRRFGRIRHDFLPAKHASLDLVGAKVRLKVVTSADKALEFPGQIVFINPEIDPLNSQVRFWAEVENLDLKLRPGMQATLTIDRR